MALSRTSTKRSIASHCRFSSDGTDSSRAHVVGCCDGGSDALAAQSAASVTAGDDTLTPLDTVMRGHRRGSANFLSLAIFLSRLSRARVSWCTNEARVRIWR